MKINHIRDVSIFVVHRASLAKHLRSDKHSEKIKTVRCNFSKETNKIKAKNSITPKL